jgi:hypothetical protein
MPPVPLALAEPLVDAPPVEEEDPPVPSGLYSSKSYPTSAQLADRTATRRKGVKARCMRR